MRAFITFFMLKRVYGLYALVFFAFFLYSHCALAQAGCTGSSATPVITSTSACALNPGVNGTSTEPAGTVIKLYKNGTIQVGSATVFKANGQGFWSASFNINSSVAVGDLLTATATVEGNCESPQSNAVKFTNGALYFRDADGDGWGVSSPSQVFCADNPVPPQGWSSTAGDCNDNDPLEFTGQIWYPDNDKDGYGVVSQLKSSCDRPAGYYARSELIDVNDCNDNDNTVWQGALIYTDQDGDGYDNGAALVCYATTPPDGLKTTKGHDCDDTNQDIWRTGTFYKDTDGDGFTLATAEQLCYGNNPPTGYRATKSTEIDCDDNNADKWRSATLYRDNDNDGYSIGDGEAVCYGASVPTGYTATKSTEIDCDDNNAGKWRSATLYRDNDNDGYSIGNGEAVCYGAGVPTGYTATKSAVDDCNDNDPAINITSTWVLDKDRDNYYTGTLMVQCTSPGTGYVVKTTQQAGDCNDNDPAINITSTWVLDKDRDNYYTGTLMVQCTSPGTGYVVKTTQQAGDCNDNDPAINVTPTWVLDKDQDNYYTGTLKVQCTSPGTGYVVKTTQQAGDCNDNDPTVNPGAVEICGNGKNDNCNNLTDEKPCYACRNATSFRSTNITCNSAIISWVSIPHPEQWQLQYKTTATGSKWKDLVLTGNKRSATLTGLVNNQSYQWHIRAKCGKNWTDYSCINPFKTLKTCTNALVSVITGPQVIDAGIESVSEEGSGTLKLYPNPSNGQFKVMLHIDDNSTGIARVQLIDLSGRTVQTERIALNNGTQQKTINISPALANGIYMVRITTGAGKVYSRKLVLEKL